MKKIAVIAAHPDDEAFGCSGTLIKSKKNGDEISYLFMTDGISSRYNSSQNEIEARKKGLQGALSILEITDCTILSFPDNQLDTISVLDITKKIEIFLERVKPDIVLTHFHNDLNVDHCMTHRAVMTACRPGSHTFVKTIMCFEVPSSTEWAIGSFSNFNPNYFVEISNYIEEKMKYVECYSSELKIFPYPRSFENLRALNQLRGSIVNVPYAEAYMLIRSVNNEL